MTNHNATFRAEGIDAQGEPLICELGADAFGADESDLEQGGVTKLREKCLFCHRLARHGEQVKDRWTWYVREQPGLHTYHFRCPDCAVAS